MHRETKDRSPARGSARLILTSAVSLVVGFVLGASTWAAFSPSLPQVRAMMSVSAAAIDSDSAVGSGAGTGSARDTPAVDENMVGSLWASWAEMSELQSDLAKFRELAESGEVEGDALRNALDRALSQLEDDELRTLLGAATKVSGDDLDDVQDLKAYARRTAEIALEGFSPDVPEEFASDRVFFTTSWAADERARATRVVFQPLDQTIHAYRLRRADL